MDTDSLDETYYFAIKDEPETESSDNEVDDEFTGKRSTKRRSNTHKKKLTPAQKKIHNEKQRELQRRRLENETPEQRQLRLKRGREYRKKYISSMSEDRKIKLQTKGNLRTKQHRDRIKELQRRRANGEPLEEHERIKLEKEELRIRLQNGKRKMSLLTEEKRKIRQEKNRFEYCVTIASKTAEEREDYRKLLAERNKRWRKKLTGEKLERYQESLKRSREKYWNNRESCKNNLKNIFDRYQKKAYEETPEQRYKRLLYFRINAAVTKLRKSMRGEGKTEEEIKVKVEELKADMKSQPMPPPEEVSAYKPRPRKQNSDQKVSRRRRRKSESTSAPVTTAAVPPPEPTISTSLLPIMPIENAGEKDDLIVGYDCAEAEAGHDLIEAGHGNDFDGDYSSPIPSPQQNFSPISTFQTEPEFIVTIETSDTCAQSLPYNQTEVNPLDNLVMAETPSLQTSTSLEASSHSVQKEKVIFEVMPDSSQETNHSDFTNVRISRQHAGSATTTWKCPLCRKAVISSNELSEHFKVHIFEMKTPEIHKRVNESCMGSSLTKKSATVGPKNSLKVLKADNDFMCLRCPINRRRQGKTFKTLDELCKHVKKTHPKYYWPCRFCKLLKYRKSSFNLHVAICAKRNAA